MHSRYGISKMGIFICLFSSRIQSLRLLQRINCHMDAVEQNLVYIVQYRRVAYVEERKRKDGIGDRLSGSRPRRGRRRTPWRSSYALLVLSSDESMAARRMHEHIFTGRLIGPTDQPTW